MASKIKGKQIATGASGIATSNLVDGVLSADVAGRAKMASGFFNSIAVVSDKFDLATIPLNRLEEPVIQADGGQAFTGNQSMAGNRLTNLPSPGAGTDAVNKDYVDNLAKGLSWQEPTDVNEWVGNATVATINAATPSAKDAYVLTDAGVLTLGALAVSTGDIVEFDGAAWVLIVANSGGFPPAGTRALASINTTLIAPLTNGADNGKIADWDGTSLTPVLTSPLDGYAILVRGDGAVDENMAFAYNGIVPTGAWVVMAGTTPFAGSGLITTVNAGDIPAGGAAPSAARGDHEHGVNTAAAVAVGTANAEGASTDLARADHVHESPAPTASDKIQTPSGPTAGDGSTTGVTLGFTPALDGYVQVFINGVKYTVGDGVKTENTYFSNDGGTTALAITALTAGDELIWNGTTAGFELAVTDVVEFGYLV